MIEWLLLKAIPAIIFTITAAIIIFFTDEFWKWAIAVILWFVLIVLILREGE